MTNSQLDTTNESQEASPFPAGDYKAHINRRTQRHSDHKTEKFGYIGEHKLISDNVTFGLAVGYIDEHKLISGYCGIRFGSRVY